MYMYVAKIPYSEKICESNVTAFWKTRTIPNHTFLFSYIYHLHI